MITRILLSEPAARLLKLIKEEGPILLQRDNLNTQEILGLVVYEETSNPEVIRVFWLDSILKKKWDEERANNERT